MVNNTLNSSLQTFVIEKRSLFWGVPETELKHISLSMIVEAILNYGNEKDIKRLFDIVSIKKTAEIFFQQISQPRTNYHKRTLNYFKLYFQKYA